MSIATSIPIIGGMFDRSGQDALDAIKGNKDLLNAVKTPELEWKDFDPRLYKTESANYELAKEDPLVRSAQMSALSKMAGLAERGLSEEDAAAFQRARSEGGQMAKAGTDAAIANAQARGVGGSGMEFAMREIANQQGSQRAQSAGLEQAAKAAQQRALYNQMYSQGMGQMRGQDAQANQANADVVNRFNMANTQTRNQTNMGNVDLQNNAQKMNNQGRNDTQQQNFNNQMSKATGQMGANRDVAQGYAAQNASNTAERNQMTQLAAMGGMAAAGMGPWAALAAKK